MDDFFSKKTCDRCGSDLKDGRIMSMLNMDCICMKCKKKEIEDQDYQKAVEAERYEIRKGNFNYKGLKG